MQTAAIKHFYTLLLFVPETAYAMGAVTLALLFVIYKRERNTSFPVPSQKDALKAECVAGGHGAVERRKDIVDVKKTVNAEDSLDELKTKIANGDLSPITREHGRDTYRQSGVSSPDSRGRGDDGPGDKHVRTQSEKTESTALTVKSRIPSTEMFLTRADWDSLQMDASTCDAKIKGECLNGKGLRGKKGGLRKLKKDSSDEFKKKIKVTDVPYNIVERLKPADQRTLKTDVQSSIKRAMTQKENDAKRDRDRLEEKKQKLAAKATRLQKLNDITADFRSKYEAYVAGRITARSTRRAELLANANVATLRDYKAEHKDPLRDWAASIIESDVRGYIGRSKGHYKVVYDTEAVAGSDGVTAEALDDQRVELLSQYAAEPPEWLKIEVSDPTTRTKEIRYKLKDSYVHEQQRAAKTAILIGEWNAALTAMTEVVTARTNDLNKDFSSQPSGGGGAGGSLMMEEILAKEKEEKSKRLKQTHSERLYEAKRVKDALSKLSDSAKSKLVSPDNVMRIVGLAASYAYNGNKTYAVWREETVDAQVERELPTMDYSTWKSVRK